MRLGKSLASARLFMLVTGMLIICTSAAEAKKSVAHFPKQLHGMWLDKISGCPPVGEASDSDMQMHIDADLLHGYEDVSKPTRVTLISSDPMSWRVESVIDVGPSGFYETDTTKIFVLGKEGLAVVAEGRGNNYQRCARDAPERAPEVIAKPRDLSADAPTQADDARKFEGEWSYRNGCDHGHHVTLELKREKGLLVGSWSDGTLLHGSQGLVRGRINQGRLVAEWCSEDEQAGAPSLCPSYEPSDDYLVARNGMLVWYQNYGQDYVEYVVLRQGIKSHQPMKACDEGK